jgi:pimeloyl-ACP methyl ester carboxylesterase
MSSEDCKTNTKLKSKFFPGNTANGNVKIHFYTAGSKKNQLVVLLHGLGATASLLECDILELSKYYYVVAPDLRGFGESDKPTTTSQYSFSIFATDVREILGFLKVKNPIVMGHSIQSFTAVVYYFQYLNDPDYAIVDLILNAPAVANIFGPNIGTLIVAIEGGNLETIASVFVEQTLNVSCNCETKGLNKVKKFVYQQALTGTSFSYQTVLGLLSSVNFFPPNIPNFTQITVPTLLIGGSNDIVVLPTALFTLALQIPNSFVVELRGAPHFNFSTNYKALAKQIHNFIISKNTKCSFCTGIKSSDC